MDHVRTIGRKLEMNGTKVDHITLQMGYQDPFSESSVGKFQTMSHMLQTSDHKFATSCGKFNTLPGKFKRLGPKLRTDVIKLMTTVSTL